MDDQSLTPKVIKEELDRYVIGQDDAKKAVAIALRNRWRRLNIKNESLRDDIIPKNILMIGPTGCGKTEIARKLAKLTQSPFIKVEAILVLRYFLAKFFNDSYLLIPIGSKILPNGI